MAAPSTSIRMTVRARANTSAASSAGCAPAATSVAVFAGVRFQITSGVPAFARFSAIASPIAPSPMKPTVCVVMTPLPNCLTESHCIPRRRIRKTILFDATHYDT
jgi:hypothetical protein